MKEDSQSFLSKAGELMLSTVGHTAEIIFDACAIVGGGVGIGLIMGVQKILGTGKDQK